MTTRRKKRRNQSGQAPIAARRSALADIDRRVAKIRLTVGAKPAGLVVRKDGNVLPLAALDEVIRTDPGEHEIVAEAPGHVRFDRKIKLAEGQTAELTIDLARL